MWGSIAMSLAIAMLAVPIAASANTITVDDASDPDGTGCTLEHAILAANTNTMSGNCTAGSASGTDVINFNLGSANTITLTGALPDITTNIDIVGPGSSLLSVSGDGQFRPFRYTNGSTVGSITGLNVTDGFCDDSCPGGAAGAGIVSTGTLTLTDVTVTANTASDSGGMDVFPEGGGIANYGGTLHLVLSSVNGNTLFATNATNQNAPSGGGIRNYATVTLDRSTVSGNTVTATGIGGTSSTNATGGGISNSGQLTVTRSTVSGNSITATGGGTTNTAVAGGFMTSNAPGVLLKLDRSTVAGNSVTAGAPGTQATSGGILASGGAGSVLDIASSTISGNSAPLYANLAYGGETQSIKNTIISNPLGGGENCSPGGVSLGFNIDTANSCGFNQMGDHINTDPLLDTTLADNGGPTLTLALLTGSPAIEAGSSSPGETIDQRGLLRPSDDISVATAPSSDGSDIGAFEVQGQPFPAPPTTAPPTTSPPTTTHRKKCKKHKKHASAAKKKCRKKKK
jgi:hypothetical protein